MLHFRIHGVGSGLETMTDCLPTLIINGLMRVSIMVTLVLVKVIIPVMPGWEGTRLLEDGECILSIIPMTLMTPWGCPQVRSSSCLMMALVPDSPAQWMISCLKVITMVVVIIIQIMFILAVIGHCNVIPKNFYLFFLIGNNKLLAYLFQNLTIKNV